MEDKKKLKKLSLDKEEIVNLNDYEMGNIKGGSTAICVTITVSAGTVAASTATIGAYSTGVEQSWWNCVPGKPESPTEPEFTKEWVTTPSGQSCLLDDVYCYGLPGDPKPTDPTP